MDFLKREKLGHMQTYLHTEYREFFRKSKLENGMVKKESFFSHFCHRGREQEYSSIQPLNTKRWFIITVGSRYQEPAES